MDIQTDLRNLLDATTPIDFDAWGRVLAYLAEDHPEAVRSWHRAPHTPATLECDIRTFLLQWLLPPPGDGLFGPFGDAEA